MQVELWPGLALTVHQQKPTEALEAKPALDVENSESPALVPPDERHIAEFLAIFILGIL